MEWNEQRSMECEGVAPENRWKSYQNSRLKVSLKEALNNRQ